MTAPELDPKGLEAAYRRGFIDGLTSHAHWREGRQEVGTTGRTLREAIGKVEETWNYSPGPIEEVDRG